jgi:hypothetical protein
MQKSTEDDVSKTRKQAVVNNTTKSRKHANTKTTKSKKITFEQLLKSFQNSSGLEGEATSGAMSCKLIM